MLFGTYIFTDEESGSVMGEEYFENATIVLGDREYYRVSRVVDGDTIALGDNTKIRYIGINTPETRHPEKGRECFGEKAKEANEMLVGGKYVRLESDISDSDRYGRLLRYVYVLDDPAGETEVFVNEYLVQNGFAFSSTYPPDVRYQDVFEEAEERARQENAGLWSECEYGE